MPDLHGNCMGDEGKAVGSRPSPGGFALTQSAHRGREVMLARLDRAIFWFTLNFAVIDFRTTMLLWIVIIGVGLGVLISLAGSERLQPAQ